jgi:DNA-binding HxlR family transcriptional regulator
MHWFTTRKKLDMKIENTSKIAIKDNRSTCPVSTALEIVGDQWSLILIRDLFLQRTTFSDFRNSPENISTNILSDRIHKLSHYNLIAHRVHPKNRKIKQYYLTEAGMKLYSMIYELSMWSKEYLDMEFHPLSNEWYQNTDGVKREKVIEETIKEYKKFKEKLLMAS